MIKLTPLIEPNSIYVFPTDGSQANTYFEISVIAPIPNNAYIQFFGESELHPVELMNEYVHTFSGFVVKNSDPYKRLGLVIYVKTDENEAFPASNKVQTQVNINQNYYTDYKVLSTTSSSQTPVTLDFGQVYNEIDLIINDGAVTLSFILNDGTTGDEVTLQPGYYSYAIQGMGIVFHTAGNSSSVQIMGLR